MRPLKVFVIFLLMCFVALPFVTKGQSTIIDSLKLKLNTTQGEEKIRTLIGLSYNFLRISTDSSLKYSNAALDYSISTNNRRGVARAYLMIGSGYSVAGNNSLALDFHLKSLEIFSEINDTAAMGVNYNNLGIDYHNLGRYSEAIAQYQKSIEIAEKLNNFHGTYFATNNIGTIYEEWNKFDLALEYYQQALNIAREINDESYIGITLQNIGVAYLKLNNLDKALGFLENSLEVNEKIGAYAGIYNTYINKGEIYIRLDKDNEAIASFKKALEISTEQDNQLNIAEASMKLGEVYTKTKDFTSAKKHLDNALQTTANIEEINLQKDIYKAFSSYYSVINDFENAFSSYIAYTTLKDTIFNRDSRGELQELQTLYELDKKEKEIEIQDLRISKQQARFYYIISGIAVLVILSLLLFNRYQLKQKAFRSELEKKNIDIEQRMLRTQMNPHFIFNSLNSINSFISDQNADAAQAFLSKFARLMRYILNNSRQSFVPLEDEINTLQLNLELEQLRFDNRFSFSIDVDEAFDPEFTYIPPMIIQPFIENAILHGLAPKKEKGQLSIKLASNGELMQCTIEDNGIGRDAAQKIKDKSAKATHKSLGMQVTKERLEILNEKTKEEVTFRIIDLKDDQDNASGTRVELTLPYEEE